MIILYSQVMVDLEHQTEVRRHQVYNLVALMMVFII